MVKPPDDAPSKFDDHVGDAENRHRIVSTAAAGALDICRPGKRICASISTLSIAYGLIKGGVDTCSEGVTGRNVPWVGMPRVRMRMRRHLGGGERVVLLATRGR